MDKNGSAILIGANCIDYSVLIFSYRFGLAVLLRCQDHKVPVQPQLSSVLFIKPRILIEFFNFDINVNLLEEAN